MTDHHSLLNLDTFEGFPTGHSRLNLSIIGLPSQRLPRAVSKLRLPWTVGMTQRFHGAFGVPRIREEVGVGWERAPSWM